MSSSLQTFTEGLKNKVAVERSFHSQAGCQRASWQTNCSGEIKERRAAKIWIITHYRTRVARKRSENLPRYIEREHTYKHINESTRTHRYMLSERTTYYACRLVFSKQIMRITRSHALFMRSHLLPREKCTPFSKAAALLWMYIICSRWRIGAFSPSIYNLISFRAPLPAIIAFAGRKFAVCLLSRYDDGNGQIRYAAHLPSA